MPLTAEDEGFLRRALTLARDTSGLASPNPAVGCVLVRDGDVLGEGAHRYKLRDHAEIVALKAAAARGRSVRGATAYVTLEPCSHRGRTGPCCDALIAAQIARCVVATVDPNPLVSGAGIAKMHAAGIDVDIAEPGDAEGVAARRLNDGFAKYIQTGLPFVTLKAALSVDGMIAPPAAARREAAPVWLTGPEARGEVQRMRHRSDAVLTGVGTVLADDPLLTDRSGLERRRPLLRVVLDAGLRTPLDSKLVRSAADDLLFFVASGVSSERKAEFAARGAEVVTVGKAAGGLDLTQVCKELARRRVLSVLTEGGSRLNGALLQGGHADAAALFFAESELGKDAIPFASGGPSPYVLAESLLRRKHVSFGEDALISGYLRDPWDGV